MVEAYSAATEERSAVVGDDVQLFAGAHARALCAREKLTRLNQDVVGRSGYATERDSAALVFGSQPRAGARINFGSGFVELAPWGGLIFPKRGDSVNAGQPGLDAAVGAQHHGPGRAMLASCGAP
jgi:hypothetical protein